MGFVAGDVEAGSTGVGDRRRQCHGLSRWHRAREARRRAGFSREAAGLTDRLGILGPGPMGAKIAVWIAWHGHLFVMAWARRSIALSIMLIAMERRAQAMTKTQSRQVANLVSMRSSPRMTTRTCVVRPSPAMPPATVSPAPASRDLDRGRN